jgi:hypothetical protein
MYFEKAELKETISSKPDSKMIIGKGIFWIGSFILYHSILDTKKLSNEKLVVPNYDFNHLTYKI